MSKLRAWIVTVWMLCAACSGGGGPNPPNTLPPPGGNEPPVEDPEPESDPDAGEVVLVGSGRSFASVQDALNAASPGDIVELGPGTYRRRITLHDGITLRGRDGAPDTIIDAEDGEGVLVFDAGARTAPIRLEDLTIRGTNADDSRVAINFVDGDLIVERCVIRDNRSRQGGGAVRLMTSAASGSAVFRDCAFLDNSSDGTRVEVVFEACQFIENTAKDGAAAMAEAGSGNSSVKIDLHNCLIHDNTATGLGAALHLSAINGNATVNAAVVHCTIANNISANRQGAGAITTARGRTFLMSHVAIFNSIVWGNRINDVSGEAFGRDVRHSLVGDGFTGDGNVGGDPLFINPLEGRFGVLPSSAAVDSGSNALVPVGLDTDLAGHPRLNGSAVDMGAFER